VLYGNLCEWGYFPSVSDGDNDDGGDLST